MDVVFYLLLGEGYGFRLVTGYAVEPPGEERNALCEGDFQMSYGREGLHNPLKVALPVLLFLQARNHGLRRANAVACCIPSHDRLTVGRLGASSFTFSNHPVLSPSICPSRRLSFAMLTFSSVAGSPRPPTKGSNSRLGSRPTRRSRDRATLS